MRPALVTAALFCQVASVGAQVAPAYQREAMAAYREKQYVTCAAIFMSALATEPRQALTPAIGAARCYAGAGESDKAERYLKVALNRGYRNCQLLDQDAVFAPLRTMARWDEFVRQCRENEERFYSSVNAELLVAFLLDQSDRREADLDVVRVRARDADRRRLVSLAIAKKSLRRAEDYYHAAMIMHHGTTVEELELARELAQRATQLDPSNANALWLYAATTDRFLQKSGRPQIYGTQLRNTGSKWTRDPYDPSVVTDAERERYRVPSVAEQIKELEELNGHR